MVQFNPLLVGWLFNQLNKGVWAAPFPLLVGMCVFLFCLFLLLSRSPLWFSLCLSTFPISYWVSLSFSLSLQPLSASLSLSPLSLFLCVSISFSLSFPSHFSLCLSVSLFLPSLCFTLSPHYYSLSNPLWIILSVCVCLNLSFSLSALNISQVSPPPYLCVCLDLFLPSETVPWHLSSPPICPFASLLWPLFGPHSVSILQVQGRFQSASTGLPHIASSESHLWIQNESYETYRQPSTSHKWSYFCFKKNGEKKGEERTKGKIVNSPNRKTEIF